MPTPPAPLPCCRVRQPGAGRFRRPSHAAFSQGQAPILPNLTSEDCNASHAAKSTYAAVPLRTARHDLQQRRRARPNCAGINPECQTCSYEFLRAFYALSPHFYAISMHFLCGFSNDFCLNTCLFPRENGARAAQKKISAGQSRKSEVECQSSTAPVRRGDPDPAEMPTAGLRAVDRRPSVAPGAWSGDNAPTARHGQETMPQQSAFVAIRSSMQFGCHRHGIGGASALREKITCVIIQHSKNSAQNA
jgi:hypothetical protein